MRTTAELYPDAFWDKAEAQAFMEKHVQKATAFVVWCYDADVACNDYRVGWLPEIEAASANEGGRR